MANGDNGNGENGSATTLIIVGVSYTVVLVLVVTFFLWQINRREAEFRIDLHNKDTEWSIPFASEKDQKNQLKAICDINAERVKFQDRWIQQNTGKNLPVEFAIPKDCTVIPKTKEELENLNNEREH